MSVDIGVFGLLALFCMPLCNYPVSGKCRALKTCSTPEFFSNSREFIKEQPHEKKSKQDQSVGRRGAGFLALELYISVANCSEACGTVY